MNTYRIIAIGCSIVGLVASLYSLYNLYLTNKVDTEI